MSEIVDRRERSFDDIEHMSPDLRACVHEYGYAIVKACQQCGVNRPANIHQLVREIWDGARQPAQKRGKGCTLDWILIQAGANISADTLLRVLENSSLAIVPLTPTREMIEASKAEVSGFNQVCTKSEKHRLRLMAAIKVGAAWLRPRLRKQTTTPTSELSRAA
jgi:hypothetical protein